MNYGRFFEFDFEGSRLDKGIAVFNYRWLQDRENMDAQKSPRYPIFLTFTSEAIVFNLHYVEGKIKHYHNPIIELFLSPNLEVTDGLSEVLNEIYFSEFPVKANNHLRTIIHKSYALEHEKERYLSKDNYSTLEIFDVEDKENYSQKNCATYFLRKLLMDFLFDFEFTGVFKNLSFYSAVSIKLRENFLFNALINKMRYYYFRTRLIGKEMFDILDHTEETQDDDDVKMEHDLQFLFQRYEAAEREWVSSITHTKAMKAFHESPWFNECHEELEQVYTVQQLTNLEKRRRNKRRYREKKAKPAPKEISQRTFVETVEDSKSLVAKKRFLRKAGITADDTFALTVSNLLTLIHKKQSDVSHEDEHIPGSSFKQSVDYHSNTAKLATKWEIDHYQFPSLFRIWCGDKKTFYISLTLIVCLFAALTGLFIYLDKNYDFENKTGWLFIIMFPVLIISLWFLGYFMRKIRRSTWGKGFMLLTMPRMLAAIVTAWFSMGMSDDIFNLGIDGGVNIPSVIILVLITCFFIAYESFTINPYDDKHHYFISSIFVYLMAYIYAFMVGLLVFDFFGERFIANELAQGEQITTWFSHDRILFITHRLAQGEQIIKWSLHDRILFIAQYSFFASFIGIFLQLMFQGKPVTKSE